MTSKSKWDGVIVNINNKNASTALVEFSGGTKVNPTMSKEPSDITILYASKTNVINSLPTNILKGMLCARFLGN